jgi:hypothetical protein
VSSSLFYEHRFPRSGRDRAEQKLRNDELDELKLVGKLGFVATLAIEHHFLEEYSHYSAPDVFLAVTSQRIRAIRHGHDKCLAGPYYNICDISPSRPPDPSLP